MIIEKNDLRFMLEDKIEGRIYLYEGEFVINAEPRELWQLIEEILETVEEFNANEKAKENQ